VDRLDFSVAFAASVFGVGERTDVSPVQQLGPTSWGSAAWIFILVIIVIVLKLFIFYLDLLNRP
jgi:hypothetical protein